MIDLPDTYHYIYSLKSILWSPSVVNQLDVILPPVTHLLPMHISLPYENDFLTFSRGRERVYSEQIGLKSIL